MGWKPDTHIGIKSDPTIKERMDLLATHRGMSMSGLCNKVLRDFLVEQEKDQAVLDLYKQHDLPPLPPPTSKLKRR